MPRDPLEQNFLVIQNNYQFYLVPMQGPYAFDKNEDKSEIVETPYLSPEVKSNVDSNNVNKSAEESEMWDKDGKNELNLASEVYNENLEEKIWKKYDKNCNLRDHMVVYSNVYPYECMICGLRLKTETLFKSHISLHKSGTKDLFHCADCDFKSAKASDLKCHQIKWHANVYKCQFCSELFQNKAVFLKHVELHTVCDQVCEDNSHLTQHKCKNQDDNNYIQQQCEDECQNDEKHAIKKCKKFNLQEYNNKNLDGFIRDLNLLKHKEFYKRKEKFYKCSQCRWSFKTINLLNKHTKRHAIFKCNECDAVFKYKASFINHKYKHKNEN